MYSQMLLKRQFCKLLNFNLLFQSIIKHVFLFVYFSSDDSNENDLAFEHNAQRFVEIIKQALVSRLPAENDDLVARKRLQDTLKNLQQLNSFTAVRLYSNLRTCLLNERQLCLPNDHPSPYALVPEQDHIEIYTTLRQLLDMVTQITVRNKQITHEYERFALNYHDYQKVNSQLNEANNKSLTPEEEQQKEILKKHSAQMDLAYNRIFQSFHQLESEFEKILIMTKSVLDKVISNYLMQWKMNQCLAGNGARFSDSLHILQDWFEHLAEIIWNTREQIKIASKTRLLFPNQAAVRDLLPQHLQEATNLLSSLITSALVIEKQPPQVMKTNTRFTATVRLLVGAKLNIHMLSPTVKVTIVSGM